VPAPGRCNAAGALVLKGRTFTSSRHRQSSRDMPRRSPVTGENVGHDRPAMHRSGRDREREELLTVEEAARYLRVTRRTLDRWRANGIGPRSVKTPSGGRRYRCEDLDATSPSIRKSNERDEAPSVRAWFLTTRRHRALVRAASQALDDAMVGPGMDSTVSGQGLARVVRPVADRWTHE